MPAATIVAAWIRAETGVGPSIASGSHACSGSWADLPTAPQKSSSGIAALKTCSFASASRLTVPFSQ